MMAPAIWTCFACYATKRTMMDTEATAVETPSCCGKPMWLTGVPVEDVSIAASNEEKK
jgi:hypothetical protein